MSPHTVGQWDRDLSEGICWTAFPPVATADACGMTVQHKSSTEDMAATTITSVKLMVAPPSLRNADCRWYLDPEEESMVSWSRLEAEGYICPESLASIGRS